MNTKDSYVTEISHEELWLIIALFFEGLGVKAKGIKFQQDDFHIFKLSVGSLSPIPNLKEIFKAELAQLQRATSQCDEQVQSAALHAMQTKPRFMN